MEIFRFWSKHLPEYPKSVLSVICWGWGKAKTKRQTEPAGPQETLCSKPRKPHFTLKLQGEGFEAGETVGTGTTSPEAARRWHGVESGCC